MTVRCIKIAPHFGQASLATHPGTTTVTVVQKNSERTAEWLGVAAQLKGLYKSHVLVVAWSMKHMKPEIPLAW